jgi:hypothetical protein
MGHQWLDELSLVNSPRTTRQNVFERRLSFGLPLKRLFFLAGQIVKSMPERA